MRKFISSLLLMLYSILLLYSENEMELMYTFEGPWVTSMYGMYMINLDYNADGIDDLLIFHEGNPDERIGCIEFHYGGSGFSSTPDYEMYGVYTGNLAWGLYACGDINGDGYDDFAVLGLDTETTNGIANYLYYFYYGGPNPDYQSDYELSYPCGYNGIYEDPDEITSCLGDLNGDGYDENGLIINRESGFVGLSVLVGGSYEIISVIPQIENLRDVAIEPLGDLNNDGYDDLSVGYVIYSDEFPEAYTHTKVYWGDADMSFSQYDYICQYTANSTSQYWFTGSLRVGDINGDGYQDFIYPREDNHNNGTYGLMFMGEALDQARGIPIVRENPYTDMHITTGRYLGRYIKHGDFNGDGYSDFVGANPDYALDDGVAGIWLGREQANGMCDIKLEALEIFAHFGYRMAVGDYNNDGFDDIAISAPFEDNGGNNTPGKVYIFAGSDQLSDTTVPNADNEVEPIPANKIKLNIYPNPTKANNIKFELVGDLPKNVENSILTVYNLKGQKVYGKVVSKSSIKSKTGSFEITNIASGTYIANIKIGKHREISSTKFIIKH